jgi:biotin carboxyl carrier protein
MDFEFLIDGAVKNPSLEKKGDSYIFREGDLEFEADIQPISPNSLSMIAEGRSHIIHFARERETLHLFHNGRHFTVQEPSSEGSVAAAGGAKSREDMLKVSAPMPGKVIKVSVEEGASVREKQTLVIVEAMKMENEVKADLNCRVKKVCCTAGDLVDVTTVLIELEEVDKDSGSS